MSDRAHDLQFHPAADIFPLLDGEAFDELVEDIREHGLQVKIELYEGKVLDGRNRYRACLLAQRPILTVEVDEFVTDPVAHVVSLNRHRRHMNPSQLAIAAGKATEMYEAERAKAEEKMLSGKADPEKSVSQGRDPQTRDKIGKQFGISGPMVDRGKKVVEQGTPALVKAVEEGRMSVTAAAELVAEPAEVQDEAAAEAKASGGRFRNKPKSKGSDGRPKIKTMATSAMQFARMAIAQLESIRADDPERDKAFDRVVTWIEKQRSCV